MTGWLPETMVLINRYKRFTSHFSGFAGGHCNGSKIHTMHDTLQPAGALPPVRPGANARCEGPLGPGP
jgi:hypothetical protein